MSGHHLVIGATCEVGIRVGVLEVVVFHVDLVEMRIEDFGIADNIVNQW
jgi:hypothetical protein